MGPVEKKARPFAQEETNSFEDYSCCTAADARVSEACRVHLSIGVIIPNVIGVPRHDLVEAVAVEVMGAGTQPWSAVVGSLAMEIGQVQKVPGLTGAHRDIHFEPALALRCPTTTVRGLTTASPALLLIAFQDHSDCYSPLEVEWRTVDFGNRSRVPTAIKKWAATAMACGNVFVEGWANDGERNGDQEK